MCEHKLWELQFLQSVQLRTLAGAFEIMQCGKPFLIFIFYSFLWQPQHCVQNHTAEPNESEIKVSRKYQKELQYCSGFYLCL